MNLKLSEVIHSCRICGEDALIEVLSLGELALTGVFLPNGDAVPKAPLNLVRCGKCGLVQLGHNYAQSELYGPSYGYESHLNSSMVQHLQRKARILQKTFMAGIRNPVVVDIASNDGTFLAGFQGEGLVRVGVDPLIGIFQDCYPAESIKIGQFFSEKAYNERFSRKANLVTSLSVIYDLNDPIAFAQDVHSILADEGIWHFEQSYLPSMVSTNSYDTICHEHLLYLSLNDIIKILNSSNFQILDASLNDINGGSISVTAIKSKYRKQASPFVRFLLAKEDLGGVKDGRILGDFAIRATQQTVQLKNLCNDYKSLNYEIFGVGASTKGNVILQASGLDSRTLTAIGEVNPRKFGQQTPGSAIDIIREGELMHLVSEKCIVIVLPWHFRGNLLPRLEGVLSKGARILFPLPQIELIGY